MNDDAANMQSVPAAAVLDASKEMLQKQLYAIFTTPTKGLEAVLTPATGSRAERLLFFVAKRDGTGSDHFSSTYKEHKKAVRRFLK